METMSCGTISLNRTPPSNPPDWHEAFGPGRESAERNRDQGPRKAIPGRFKPSATSYAEQQLSRTEYLARSETASWQALDQAENDVASARADIAKA
jgi:hypothetical protein